jgi:hypothetical protein
MRSARRALLAALAALVAAGCIRREYSVIEVTPDVMRSPDMRSAGNLPERFTVVTPPENAGDCPPVLRDTGLHTTLRLQRSVLRQVADSTSSGYRAIGDYAIEPHGRYGELEGEGLRVDCSRMSALGVIRL